MGPSEELLYKLIEENPGSSGIQLAILCGNEYGYVRTLLTSLRGKGLVFNKKLSRSKPGEYYIVRIKK